MFKNFIAKRRAKKLKKYNKWLDVYGIDNMSDEDFLLNRKKLVIASIRRIVLGLVLFVASVLVLILLWDNIFWSSNRWWF